jgi:transcription antitermination factor NusG
MTLLLVNAPPAAAAPAPVALERWFAAYTCARHEKKVAHQLEERGIECFLPVYHSVRRWKDRRKQLDMVLFPSYVFVKLAMKDRLRVLQLPGVVRFVTFNGEPAILPAGDIEALRNGMTQQLQPEHHPYLIAGRRVKVVHGPLAGAEGFLSRWKNSSRLVISIDAIMRSISVEIDETDVVPLFGSASAP